MSVSLVGSGKATAATIAIPAHQAGDMIIIIARRASNTPATIPAGWTTIQSAGANTLALSSAYRIATGSAHTSGTWTNASNLVVLVYRSNVGILMLGASAVGSGNNQTFINYPGLVCQNKDLTSTVVRVGTKGTTSPGLATPPSGTHLLVEPTTSPLIGVHHEQLAPENISGQAITASPSAANRAHSIEVREDPPPAPVDETSIDDFNRANGRIDAGAGAALWHSTGLYGGAGVVDIADNAITGNGSSPISFSKFKFGLNFDLLLDCVVPPATSVPRFGFLFGLGEEGSAGWDGYYFSWYSSRMDIDNYVNGSYVANLATFATSPPVAGDSIWIAKRGTTITVYRRPPGGIFSLQMTLVNSLYNRVGAIAVATGTETTTRWDNLRGGPIYIPPKSIMVV